MVGQAHLMTIESVKLPAPAKSSCFTYLGEVKYPCALHSFLPESSQTPSSCRTPAAARAPALGGAGSARGMPGSGGGHSARAGCGVVGQEGPREGAARSGHSEGQSRAQALGDMAHIIPTNPLPLARLLGAHRDCAGG